MNITVQLFSFLRQLAGQNELQVTLPGTATVADLLTELYRQKPRLREADATTLIAIGVEFAQRESRLTDGDIVSLMPPLQGGVDDELTITDRPIDGMKSVVAGDVGGVVIFWGVVRDQEAGNSITALNYTAYQEMAEHQFRKLIGETKQRWPVKRVRVVHRLGVVKVGEPSLLVRIEASHRGEAFAAAQFLIDELKQKVPIWKSALLRDREL